MCLLCKLNNMLKKKYNLRIYKLYSNGMDIQNLKNLIICKNCNDFSNLHYLYNLESLCCPNSNILFIPKELINLKILSCRYTNISYIPKELIKLESLYCGFTNISYIPKELINLKSLSCENTHISSIPKELINLNWLYCANTEIYNIPFELYNLQNIVFTVDEIIGNIIIPNHILIRININKNNKIRNKLKKIIYKFRRIKQFKILWKIAEYYTAKKYSPNNILKYIKLD